MKTSKPTRSSLRPMFLVDFGIEVQGRRMRDEGRSKKATSSRWHPDHIVPSFLTLGNRDVLMEVSVSSFIFHPSSWLFSVREEICECTDRRLCVKPRPCR